MVINQCAWLESHEVSGAWKHDFVSVFPMTDNRSQVDAKGCECVKNFVRKDGLEVTIRFRI